jgi:cell shape-determining protein MreC
MRVRSLHKPNRDKRNKRIRIVVVSLFVIFIGFLVPKAFSLVSAVIVYPFHATSIWIEESSSLVPSLIRDRGEMLDEIESLKNQLAVANGTSLTQTRLFEENNNLRNLLNIDTEARTAAAVIARPNELPYDLLQIDRGSKHGIEVGAPVFIGKDVVIGLIVHVAPEYSFVEMVTSSGFEATAFIVGPNVVVSMEGVGGGVARVRVPQGVPLAVGNLVYLPSVEPGVFGRVSYVENEPSQPEQYGYISPDISVSSLYRVAVGKLSQISQSPEVIEERVRERIKETLFVESVILDSVDVESEEESINPETE